MSITLKDVKDDILLEDDLETSPRDVSFEDDGWDDDNACADWDEEDEGDWGDRRPSPIRNDLYTLTAKRERSVQRFVTEESIDKLMAEAVKPLMDMGFDFSLSQAQRIAHCFEWKIRKASDKITRDLDKVLENCGILLEKKDALLPKKGTMQECQFCLDELPAEDFRAYLYCGHSFCQNCWVEEISTWTAEGMSCLNMCCPQHKCGIAISSLVVENILKDGSDEDTRPIPLEQRETWQRYRRFFHKGFVDTSPNLDYCPAPNCNIVHSYTTGIRKDITCECKHQFCWRCKNTAHNPCSCENMETWTQKYNDEGETVKWITVNAKKCPRCKTPIEKNQGCMHMTCRSSMGCGHEFCWLCLGDWKTHGSKTGGFYKCTIYEERKKTGKVSDDEKKREEVKSELDRYTFHLKMYDDCIKGSAFARKQIPIFDKEVIKRSRNGGSSMRNLNWSFVTNAMKEVELNKRMCGFIYVMLYYMPRDSELTPLQINKKQILQEQQAFLLAFSDRLQNLTETHKDNFEELTKVRGTINDLIRTASKFRITLTEHINRDIIKDELAF